VSALGLKPDVLFCFDIRLPQGFTPKPQDGEVGAVAWACMHAAKATAGRGGRG